MTKWLVFTSKNMNAMLLNTSHGIYNLNYTNTFLKMNNNVLLEMVQKLNRKNIYSCIHNHIVFTRITLQLY